ncbi:MAG: hypothetical protein KC417_02095, partial [Myxococcales bacterium]|nr:hypothetical protein [Myxococcales bacterium]
MAVDADWALRAERAAHRRDRQLDAETRRSNGVVHTPPAVARWVAAEAHAALCGELGLAAGLADPSVTIVDPACGPGVFLAAALDVAGALGAPHAVLGVDLDKRATDVAQETFGEDFKAAGWPLMFRTRDALVDLEVGPVRADDGVCVVLGNPPWLARGARAGAFVDSLMGEFRRDST